MTVEAVKPEAHVVAFYDDDEGLAGAVATFLSDALLAGEAGLVIATPDHRARIADLLDADGLDVDALRAAGRYVPLDARKTVDSFMDGDAPDPTRFRRQIGSVMTAAAEAGGHVHAFGEMVALLWDAGNVAAAIAVEALWNDLSTEYRFSLLCGYPVAAMAESDLGAASAICGHHSGVIGPASYASGADGSCGRSADECTRQFVPVPSAVTAARGFVVGMLRAWELAALVPDAQIVVSELATNAVRHATSAFRVTIERPGAAVRISVTDVQGTMPVIPIQPRGAIGGLGLALVERLSSSWGTELLPDGKAVWAELSLV